MEISGYWISYCNPAYFEIEEFLSSGETHTTWTVMDWQKQFFEPGQQGVIRVGNDNRSLAERNGSEKLERGIYAIFEIISHAGNLTDPDGKLWLNIEKRDKKKMRVRIRLIKNLLYSPILLDKLKDFEETKNEEALIQGRQASSWSLSEQAFMKILELSEVELKKIELLEEETIQSFEDIIRLEEKYKNSTPTFKEIISRRIERGDISKLIKKHNNYRCQVCESIGQNPISFIKKNGEPYIETHHIIPVSELTTGLLGVSNLMTICANHHRQIHFGNVKILSDINEKFIFNIDGQLVKIEKIRISNANN